MSEDTAGLRARKRDLGSSSAEHDPRFAQHFVDTPEFSRLLDDSVMIVSGAKGSGKTAVMRALADIYSSRYSVVFNVKLDGLRFGPLFAAIQKLNHASNQGLVAIARSTWQNVVGIFVLEGILTTNLLAQRDRGAVQGYLRANGHLRTAATEKFGDHLEQIWRLIAKWSQENESSEQAPIIGLSPRQQAIIGAFPRDGKIDQLLHLCMQAVRASGKRFQLCFDGLDSVVEHSIESRDYIFAGLIDATYKCATHPLFSNALSLKVLLPKELAHGARRRLRDLDKQEDYFAGIHWNETNLAEFIRKRLEQYLRAKNRSFDEVWREYFPERLRNDVHGVEEETYAYVLRHTLYRPRQVLKHVQAILDAWDQKDAAPPFKVDPTFIQHVVAETNYRLSEHVVNELMLDFPNLEAFLKSFRNSHCTMQWVEVASRVERFLGVPAARVEEVFLDLYNYGVFGVPVGGQAETRKGQQAFRFGFMTPNVERHVLANFSDRTPVALAPMFAEYCGCRPSPGGVVMVAA